MASGIGLSANEDTVESVFRRNYRYEVPDYQRQYSWEEEQWDALWKDLTALEGDDTHFLGSLVVIERSGGLNDPNVLEVVDGQQRLTTLSILLMVIRERYLSAGKEESAENIDDMYLWESQVDRDDFQKLTLSRFDNDIYESLLERRWDEAEDGLLQEAFEFYTDKLDDLDIEGVDFLRKRLLRSMTLVTIECDGEQSAFRLFETLNDRGMELSSVDLMKNYLFSLAAQRDDVDYDEVKTQWQRIVDAVVPALRKPSMFFRHYLMSTPEPDLNDSVSNYKLYDVFQTFLDERVPESSLTIEEFIRDIARQSRRYVDLVNCEIDSYDESGNGAINTKLEHLEMLKSGQARTLMLRIFREFESPNRAIEALQVLEKFLVRWKVANYATGSELDRLYADVCSTAFDSDDPVESIRVRLLEKAPSDPEVRAGIENKRMKLNDQTRYMLYALEEKRFDGVSADEFPEADLEHVAPRAAFSAEKYNAWPAELDTTEAIFEERRDVLGNLTLLETDKNVEAGANPFDAKKAVYETSRFAMTRAIAAEYDSWTMDDIDDRTTKMARLATDLWSLER